MSACRAFCLAIFRLATRQGARTIPNSQAYTLALALRVLESAPAPRSTVQSPLRWSEAPSWKLDYCNIERLSAEELERRRHDFDRQKEIAKNIRTKPEAVP